MGLSLPFPGNVIAEVILPERKEGSFRRVGSASAPALCPAPFGQGLGEEKWGPQDGSLPSSLQ